MPVRGIGRVCAATGIRIGKCHQLGRRTGTVTGPEGPPALIPLPSETKHEFARLRTEWLGNVKGDLLAGLVVALALIPEAIAFSIIAGVDPKVGLYASFSIAVLDRLRRRPARHDLGRHRRRWRS